MDSIQNFIATSKMASTRKVISHMPLAFQAVSKKLGDGSF